jgi:hypothetical protein
MRKIALGLPRPETAIAEDGTAPTSTERVAAEYKEEDEKNFTPIAIETSNSTPVEKLTAPNTKP